MNFDWIIAIALFLVFVSWSFVYYMGAFSFTPDTGSGVEGISGKVIGFLETDSYDVPVEFSSPGSGSRVLYLDFSWPAYSKNSTRIFSGDQPLPCMISGDRVYWQADLSAGSNIFTMRYCTENTTPQCSSLFPPVNATQAMPWAAEKGSAISQARTDQMLATNFYVFRQALGINSDFRVELESGGIVTAYGPAPPLGYDVYVKETPHVTEDREAVTVRVLTW
jgi:hypothetical protein